MLDLQAPSIKLTASAVDSDKTLTTAVSAGGTQDTEFSKLFGLSLAPLETSQALSQETLPEVDVAGATAVTWETAEEQIVTGQELPLSGEDLPLEGQLDTAVPVSALPDTIGNQLDVTPATGPAPQPVLVASLSTAGQVTSVAKPAVSLISVTEPAGRVTNTQSVQLQNTQNNIYTQTGITATLNTTVTQPATAESVIAVNAGNTDVKQPGSVVAQSVAATVSTQEALLASQNQGSGTRQNLDTFSPQDINPVDVQSSKSDIKMDFSQLLDKTPAMAIRDLPALDTAIATNKLSGGIQKAPTELLQLYQHINKPGWGQEFGTRVVMLSKEGMQSAQLRLTPAHLGTIDIRISIEQDQARISFLSQNSAVRDVIEASLPKLRDMMQDAGVKLENVNVSAQSSNPENRQQSQLQRGQDERQPHTSPFPRDEDAGQTEQDAAARVMEVSMSAVDYYA